MGAHIHPGTMPGALTPICNACMTVLCWDISEEEYEQNKQFWDAWICRDCNNEVPFTKANYASSISKTT